LGCRLVPATSVGRKVVESLRWGLPLDAKDFFAEVPVSQKLDDLGAVAALSSFRNVGARFRARHVAGKIALVYAVALRPMARD